MSILRASGASGALDEGIVFMAGELGRARLDAGAPMKALKVGTTKIGRNDPCPCGSGQKYKRCCAT